MKIIIGVILLILAIPLALFICKKVFEVLLVATKGFWWVIRYCWPIILIVVISMVHPPLIFPAVAIAVIRYVFLFKMHLTDTSDAKYWGNVK